MAEETTDATTTVETPEAVGTGAAAKLHQDVMAAITERSPSIRTAVVEHLVQEKLKERERAALTGLAKLKEARANYAKIKPAPAGYDDTGKPVAGLFTKEQIEERKKTDEQIKKLEQAIELALGEKADYSKLLTLVGTK